MSTQTLRPIVLVASCKVYFSVCLDQRFLAVYPWQSIAVLHPHHSLKTFGVDELEDILVVDLASCGLFTAGIITDLDICNLTPGLLHHRNQVALVALHVVDVVKDLAAWTPHGFADHIGLIGMAKEQIRIVAQRLQHHGEACRLEDLCSPLQGFDDVSGLHAHW